MISFDLAIRQGAQCLAFLRENPFREARLLLGHILKTTYETIYFNPEYILTDDEEQEFNRLIERRMNREPLSKITERREFWSLPFKVTRDTLDPRPDSETLIEAVLKNYTDKNCPLKIIDLGTGTGCLLLSLLHEYPNAWGVGVDISEKACRIARENAQNLKLETRCSLVTGNWADALKGSFDIVISNPPYIGFSEIIPLAVSVYDPPQALYAEENGLAAYRQLVKLVEQISHPQARLFLEISAGQQAAVNHIFNRSPDQVIQDLNGHDRCLVYCL
jgi:release factor glutamine methyltransferase